MLQIDSMHRRICPPTALTRKPSNSSISTNITYPQKPSTKSSLRKRKTVDFNLLVAVKTHLHLEDMTTAEMDSVWYSKEEYKDIKLNCIPVVRLMGFGMYQGDDESNNLCARGLESRTRERSMHRKLTKMAASQAVISEQARQRRIGRQSDENVKRIYSRISHESRLAARERGHSDWCEARWIHENDADEDFDHQSNYSDDMDEDMEEEDSCVYSASSSEEEDERRCQYSGNFQRE